MHTVQLNLGNQNGNDIIVVNFHSNKTVEIQLQRHFLSNDKCSILNDI